MQLSRRRLVSGAIALPVVLLAPVLPGAQGAGGSRRGLRLVGEGGPEIIRPDPVPIR